MGRRKIQIAPITDDRNRNVTFGKRRNGLFKKAYELGVLCSVDVAVLVWGHNGKLFAFSSQGNLKGVVDRYNIQSQDEMDVIGPRHYGGEVSPSVGLHATPDMNGVKESKGGNKRRRKSDDDSDEDDDDADEDADFPLGSSGLGQAPLPQSTASSLPNDLAMYPNGSPNIIEAQRFQQQQQQQQAQQAHSALSSHPFFGNYPYPGYPHHMPNVNPALGNPLGFYAPSAAAMAAAAAATGQYNYGGLPPHLLRAAAQQYAQENGSSNSTPSSGNVQAAGYTPIVNSPTSMDVNQQQQAQAESSNSYANRQSTGNNQSVPGSSPRSGRKPALHLNFSNSNNGPSRSQNQAGPSRNSSMNENDGNGQQQHQQQQYSHHNLAGNNLSAQQQQQQTLDEAAAAQEAAAVSAYAEQAGLNIPPIGMQFPDSFLTSPSQLFPEIYRSMNAFAESQAHRAMTFGAENTPGIDEDDITGNDHHHQNGRNVFRWPTLGNLGSSTSTGQNNATNNNSSTNNSNNATQGQERNNVTHSNNNSNNDGSSHLRVNGQGNDTATVKRENDNETEIAT